MQFLHALIPALLVISNVTLAEPQTGSASIEPPDARVLLAQAQSEPPRTRNSGSSADDEALALAALEGLMAQPAQRALPILKRVLSGTQSATVKQRALFVLSQIDMPEAQTLLVDTARSGDPALRGEAIRSIGIGGDRETLAALQDIYRDGDATAKKSVLEAWLISDSRNEIYQAALNATSDDEANDAIRILGAMGASEELRKLGELRKPGHDLIDAYAISGDLASLRRIVDGEGNLTTRVDAVRKIGIVDSAAARAALREIYTKSPTPELRKAALEGMLVSGDEEGVLTLYRAAQSPDDKRALLRTLSLMDGDAALQAIDAALETKR